MGAMEGERRAVEDVVGEEDGEYILLQQLHKYNA